MGEAMVEIFYGRHGKLRVFVSDTFINAADANLLTLCNLFKGGNHGNQG